MSNPFEPPTSQVTDAVVLTRPSWPRTLFLILGFSAVSLVLAWFVVPAIASLLPLAWDPASPSVPPEFLAVDLALSFLVFVAGCYGAARLSNGHAVVAALGVAAAGSFVYFYEVGGWDGILNSSYPMWYEFFPSHALSAAIAIILTRRLNRRAGGS